MSSLNIIKALLILNAKKGWSDAARKKAALTRKAKKKGKSKSVLEAQRQSRSINPWIKDLSKTSKKGKKNRAIVAKDVKFFRQMERERGDRP